MSHLRLLPALGFDRRVWLALVALAAGMACAACARPAAHEQRYSLKGKIISVDRVHSQVVVEHEEVVGLMPGMTMPFTLKDKDVLDTVAAGDQIQATLVVSDDGVWLEHPVITKPATPGADSRSGASASEPEVGAPVPDVALVNQDERPVHLARYRGRALLITFIYTRCPMPDYCPLMSTNFAEINRAVRQDPSLARAVHLLSVTLDPQYDTPKVLRSYGGAYTERYGEEKFDTWEFATGDEREVRRLAQFFGLVYGTEEGQIIHSLRTALVAPDGRLYKLYRGNEWKPEEVLGDVRELLARGATPSEHHA